MGVAEIVHRSVIRKKEGWEKNRGKDTFCEQVWRRANKLLLIIPICISLIKILS